MFKIKPYKMFIILYIMSIQFNIIATELSQLQENNIYQELDYTILNDFSNKITLFDIDYIIYAYLVPSTGSEVNKYIKLNMFYMFMNCSFAEWTQHKLFKFVRKFPLFHQATFLNKYNNVFNKNYKRLLDNLSDIKTYVQRFVDILLCNFLHLANSRDYDTSFIKTLLLLKLKIHFLTLPSKNDEEQIKVNTSDVVVIRSILRIMNSIQKFMVTNCNVYKPNEEYRDNIIKSTNIFGFWITKSAETNDLVDKILEHINKLDLENKRCYTQQMLLTYIVTDTPSSIISREISNAKVETKFGTIMIYQIVQQIEKHDGDLELILWYQESIYNAIVKLIYNKAIAALNICPYAVTVIVNSIPNFLDLPDDFTDLFAIEYYTTDEKIKLIDGITKLRNSITNIILETDDLTQFIEVSNFVEFTTYINSSSEDFFCFFSLLKFLRKEFAKYYIPFISNPTKIEEIVKYKNVPIREIVRSDVDDKLSNSMCQYVRDLYGLCLDLTIILNMIEGKAKDVIDQYLSRANTILTTIRERSIDVMQWCTYKECGDLLKVSYDLYVVLNPKHRDHFKFHQKPMITMVMSILNTYGIDHCNPPNFNFLLLINTNFEDIGNDDIYKNRLNSFVKTLGINQNSRMISNFDLYLNIDDFYQHYISKANFSAEDIQMISFFWKGEKKNIDEVYKNINAIIIHPSHVYAFYDLYFKFVIGILYSKMWVILHFLTIKISPKINIFNSDECLMFLNLCELYLNISNFPQHLSVLVIKVSKLSSLLFKLCSRQDIIFKEYEEMSNKKNQSEIKELSPQDNELSSDENSTSFYTQILDMKSEIDRLFEMSGMFVLSKTKTVSLDFLTQFFKPNAKFVKKVFNNMTQDFCYSLVTAYNILTDILINI
ncbi:uncharacterized protein LOC132922757 [Rhopalosiphum padi]|uniref:uncharacterized protein LOC132922757 n=1 Tax=Rhopalosiphum padi TaxID=40932 RepID=UPI00298E1E30|nr:uncharacterized protein LOC132922757 [Rhopalosiphum padi]XP_060842426.1 uncharacterized protein LOC132922757 [Rhopalosiphum padi]XP_060842427.1 uncharacterized protein LOC132922757 [Rhopalosiphum padi]XP_060842428.1 uncharacterized protein LOC132922757 [Rhopalosiphum padi]